MKMLNGGICPRHNCVKIYVFPRGVIKINWNVVLDKTINEMGVDIIVRDHKGNVLEIMRSSKLYIIDLMVAELFAAWKAVEFGRDMGTKYYIRE
jgi:hypothetical protein